MLIHAAAGGVGSVAGQLARALGAGRVLGMVGSAQKIASAQSSGYDQVFLREGFVESVRSVTEGQGVDIVLDAAGEPTRSQSLSLLAPFGRMVHFGNASGNPEVPIAPATLLSGNKGVLGYSLSNLRQDDPSHLVATAQCSFVSRSEPFDGQRRGRSRFPKPHPFQNLLRSVPSGSLHGQSR